MSASHSKRDGFLFSPRSYIDPLHKTMMETMFDHQVTDDFYEIQTELQEAKLLKRLSIVKTLLAPIEYPLMVLFMEKGAVEDYKFTQKLYWKLLRNKITCKQFKKEMMSYT